MLHATVIVEGRPASIRREVFSPGSCLWPATGVEVRTKHLGAAETTAIPVRGDGGAITVEVAATPGIIAAVRGGARFASVEFHPLAEQRAGSGTIREVLKALLTGVSLTADPEYLATKAEVRTKQPRRVWI